MFAWLRSKLKPVLRDDVKRGHFLVKESPKWWWVRHRLKPIDFEERGEAERYTIVGIAQRDGDA